MSVNWKTKFLDTKIHKMAVISDPQINLKEGSDSKEIEILKASFQHIDTDVLVLCGDITQNALSEEWKCFFDTYKVNCPSKYLFLIPGNEDATEYPEGKQTFLDTYNTYVGLGQDNTYFIYEADNCMFIGLSPEQDDDEVPLSELQLTLLEEAIEKAAKRSIPAFVFCHYLMNDTIHIDWKYATLGVQSLRIKSIFEKYEGKVICFSGHIHRGLMKKPGGSVITMKNVTYISTPSFTQPDKIHYLADNDDVGTGYLLNLDSEYVQVKGYDFLNNKDLNDFIWNI